MEKLALINNLMNNEVKLTIQTFIVNYYIHMNFHYF